MIPPKGRFTKSHNVFDMEGQDRYENWVELLINDIYRGTEGEGTRIGTPQVFVRFQGCAVGCHNCDSKDTWHFSSSRQRPLEAVVQRVEELMAGEEGESLEWVSLTGGDPLHLAHREGLIIVTKKLKERGYRVNLEASGTVIIPSVFQLLDYISFDYKTPSTGVSTDPMLILQLAKEYPHKFQVKSVVADDEDILAAWRTLCQLRAHLAGHPPFSWCLTPSWERSEEFPRDRFQRILQKNRLLGGPFRVIGQQHKWVYGVERMDV